MLLQIRLIAAVLLLLPSLASPQRTDWNQPFPAFRILGNIYYVGASDLTSYLITTPEGHILIDSGLKETVPYIRAGVDKLGFRMQDIKIILNSHAHYDHAAGLAELKRLTGAKILLMKPDAELAARGGKGDFAFGDKYGYEQVSADKLLADGDVVSLGKTRLTAHHTPGHTKGSTTWTMQVMEDGKPYEVVFATSLSAPGYRLKNNPAYPNILADYTRSRAVLRSLNCDVFLGPHGNFYDLSGKYARLAKGDKLAFVDREGLKKYVDEWEKAVEEQAAKER
jgi:metallo-beta-lactamase class B